MLVFDARHGVSGSLVDRYLLNTLVATSMLLRHDHDPGQLCDQLLIAAEMETGVLAEVDSLQKLFVRKPVYISLLMLGSNRSWQTLVATVSRFANPPAFTDVSLTWY
jgi:hypothetical protein